MKKTKILWILLLTFLASNIYGREGKILIHNDTKYSAKISLKFDKNIDSRSKLKPGEKKSLIVKHGFLKISSSLNVKNPKVTLHKGKKTVSKKSWSGGFFTPNKYKITVNKFDKKEDNKTHIHITYRNKKIGIWWWVKDKNYRKTGKKKITTFN